MPIKNMRKFISINDEDDWKLVKVGNMFSYKCKECGKTHIKIRYNSSMDMKRCVQSRYRNTERIFKIKNEEDWKLVKKGWYISYICNKCGEEHIKFIEKEKDIKNDCYMDPDISLVYLPYYFKEMPFKINKIYDWAIVRPSWYVKYKCPICNKNHVRKILNKNDKGFKCIK